MADNHLSIPSSLFYGNRNPNEDSDDDNLDFEGSSSSEYVPSDSEFSDSDCESSDDELAVGVHVPSDIWTAVTGRSLKTFAFLDSPSTSGISQMDSQSIKPIDCFHLMVTNEIYELIVFQTNLNAHQFVVNNTITRGSRIKKWNDTNILEIKKFLGIVMYMGIVKYPSISSYWSKDIFYKNNFVPQVMPRNRFQLLLKFIHFADNTKIKDNRLGKVNHLLQTLEKNYVNARIPGEILAVDESMIPWRGRLQFRQYNPGKSHKYGIKVYKLCDPNGYTFTSSVYGGKCDQQNQRGRPTANTSHSTQIVLDLADKYLDKGRTIATDNYYTSVSLAKLLIDRGTHLVGTLRSNRSGNPTDVIKAKLKKNDIIGRENSGIVVAKWKDKRDVLMLSTKHNLDVVCTGKRNRNNFEVRKLKMIAEYNLAKQGIDISDQMACYFTPLRKSIRWYHKVAFEFLLSTSVVNALVIYKQIHRNTQILKFRQAICEGLCEIDPSSSSNRVKHVMKEYDTRDKSNRKTRKRCSGCYNDIKKKMKVETLL